MAEVKAGRIRLYRVTDNTKWSHTADDAPQLCDGFPIKSYITKLNVSCIFHQLTGRGCSLLTSCSFTYSCQTMLNKLGLTN